MNLFDKVKLFDQMVAQAKVPTVNHDINENKLRALEEKYGLAKKAQGISPDARKALMGLQPGSTGAPAVDLNQALNPVVQFLSTRSSRAPISPEIMKNVMQNAAQSIDAFVNGSQDKNAARNQVSAKLEELKKLPGFSANLPTLLQASKALGKAAPAATQQSKSPAAAPKQPTPAQKPVASPAVAPAAKKPAAAPPASAGQMHNVMNDEFNKVKTQPTSGPSTAPGWERADQQLSPTHKT